MMRTRRQAALVITFAALAGILQLAVVPGA